jgi:alpha-beta hydrolase superfamily lysophospholipase
LIRFMEARHEEGRFAGVGGLDVRWQAWLPDREPRATVLISHGAAEHGGRYAWTAEQLVARGCAVYAIDHRGHGRSAGPRAYVDRVDNAVADLHTLSATARERQPGAPLFLLGHSMGGLIALAYASRHQDELSGLVLSAPLAVLEANPSTRLAGRVLSAAAPRLPVYKIDGTTVSRDPQVVRAYDDDPLNHRGMLPARTVGELAATVAALPDTLPELRLPILTVYGTADRLVDNAGSRLVDELCGSADSTLIAYDGLYHEVLNEPERERVIADVGGWIDAHVPAASTVTSRPLPA